jgi:hypothetical protein
VQQLTYTAPNELEWREASEPSLSSDAAALVRPVAVATCDLGVWDAIVSRINKLCSFFVACRLL